MPTKTIKKKTPSTIRPIDPSEADVIPAKLRRKREELPSITTLTKKPSKNRKTKQKSIAPSPPPPTKKTRAFRPSVSLVDVIIDQHENDDHRPFSPTGEDAVSPSRPVSAHGPAIAAAHTMDRLKHQHPQSAQPEMDGRFVLRMALTEEEKKSTKMYTKQQLEWRKKKREQIAYDLLASKRKAKQAKKMARREKKKKKKKNRATTRTKKLKSSDRPVVQVDDQRLGVLLEQSVKPADTKPNDGNATKVTPASPVASRTSSRAQRHPSRRSPTSPSRDKVFHEFRQLLFATGAHKSKLYREQFRGGNPYLKNSKHSMVPWTAKATKPTQPPSPKSHQELQQEKKRARKHRMRVAGRFEYQDDERTPVYYCASRMCANVLDTFSQAKNKCLVKCVHCGCLNNRNHFIHVDEKRKRNTAPSLPLVQSHAEISRAKFKLKLRDRFLDDMSKVIRTLSTNAKAKVSPGKRIWKEFDRTQQRLAHTWKQPTPGPQDYGVPFEGTYNKRVMSHAKSQPSYNFAPARHKKKTSIDM